jgi:hypothetical protein
VLAWRGSEGCDSQVKLDEKENEEVVGRTKGYGIFWFCDSIILDCWTGIQPMNICLYMYIEAIDRDV